MASAPPDTDCTIGTVEVRVRGELDLASLDSAGVVLDRILSLRPEHVVIDLSHCRHIDATAIGLMVDVRRRLQDHHGVLSIRDPHPRVRRILQVARLDQVLPIITTVVSTTRGARRPDAGCSSGPAASNRQTRGSAAEQPGTPADAPLAGVHQPPMV